MLEFDGEPRFLNRYAVSGYMVNQVLGEVGTVAINLHPSRFISDAELRTHADLQEMLGEEVVCRDGDWEFAGTVDTVETNTHSHTFRVVLTDSLSKLGKMYGSRVFADQTVEDIASALMPEGQDFQCLGDAGSTQVFLAIQYQESNLAFLKRVAHNAGAQVWCAGSTIYVGTEPIDNSFQLRLGRDLRHFSVRTRLGPESVEVNSVPYAQGNSMEQSTIELDSTSCGDVQDAAIDARRGAQDTRSIHVVHEDSSYNDTAHLAQRHLRSRAWGRFLLTGTARTPVQLGCKLEIENYDRVEDEVVGTEQTVIRAINVVANPTRDENEWHIEATNPQALIGREESLPDRLITSTAIVDDVEDPLQGNRVRVYFPWDPNECSLPWLRITTPSWGADHAHYMPPKIGDTVFVAWGQRDMDPVILGCVSAGDDLDLYDQTLAIKTVDGQKITISDSNIKLLNEAGGGGTEIEILGDQVVIRTSNGQEVTIGSNSLKLDSGGGASLEVQSTKIVLNATEIELTGTSQVKINGSAGVNINNGALEVI